MNTASSLELLESRVAPAALTAKLLAGVLTISGDPVAGNVAINESGTTIDVLDGATSLGSFDDVASIKFVLIGGADITATFPGGGLPGSFKLTSTGATSLTIGGGSSIGGKLRFLGDAAVQTFTTGDGVSIGKNLIFNGGGGSDSFTVGPGTSVARSVVFKSVESGMFQNTSDIMIGNDLTFQNTNATLNTNIQTTDTSNVTVGGFVSYFGSAGDDNFFIKGVFSKTVTFTDPAGSNGLGLGFGSIVHGSVLMTTGGGNDGFNIQAGTIDGSVKLSLGKGNNTFFYGIAGSVTIGRSVIFTAGDGDDQWKGFGGGMTIGGRITAALGNGTNAIAVGVDVSGTSIRVITGSGVDTVAVFGTAPSAAIFISLGPGADSLAGSALNHPASALFDGGSGLDHFSEDTVVADPVIIRGFEDFS